MNKGAIQRFAIWARNELIAQVSQRAYQYGITKEGCGEANAVTVGGRALTADEQKQRKELVDQIRSKGYAQVMEEVVYTWFNRFIALRFMEVNNYLPSHIRVFSDSTGAFKPEILSDVLHLDLPGLNREKVAEYIESNDTEGLYRYLLLTQCNALNDPLPRMFEKMGGYTELLLPNNILKQDSVLGHMVADIPEEDWTDQVQIIGWLYQYYNDERKNEVINIYKGTVKKDDIPAATQLFTTDWVVRYMVDNSLGRYWIERHPESKLAEKLEFFVTPKNGEINHIDEFVKPEDVKFLDPCMGSGHILVYAFDVLMEIYKESGYTERDAAAMIVQNNLFGLDIDDRASQLAYFAVMMKARSYDRRFLSRGIKPNVLAIKESNGMGAAVRDGLTTDAKMNEISWYLVDTFRDAKELGSIITAEPKDYDGYMAYLDGCNGQGQLSMDDSDWLQNTRPMLKALARQAKVLATKYPVVCTNPPYLNRMEGRLKSFILDRYKDVSGDLFSVFIYRDFLFCTESGYSAFMTPFVWMFTNSYEPLRRFIIATKSVTTLVQMEYSAFEEATVPICSFVLSNHTERSPGLYIKLSDFKGGMDVQRQKVLEALNDKCCGYFYETPIKNYKDIEDSPFAFWASLKVRNAFKNCDSIGKIAPPKQGLATADNDRFLRRWYEVNIGKIGFGCSSCADAVESRKKWFPYNKGGAFRRWYGNREYVVNWENDGYEIKNFRDSNGKVRSRPQNLQFYFRPGITWSDITSASFSGRYSEKGFMFDIKGSSGFPQEELLPYVLGFLNSLVSQKCIKILNPTITTQVGDMARIPVVVDEQKREAVEKNVASCIAASRSEWDSSEISWDFKRNPLVNGNRLAAAYTAWKQECEDRFRQLQKNEEELNRIFIDIYGLQDELTPDVADKDVTVHRVFNSKDDVPESMKGSNYVRTMRDEIVSLISYAVGCMFGRYSLDVDGLAYAGGEWDESRYKAIVPDSDNIIPICDDEYFDDDITGRFVKWVETVYGKETLEENLKFIADALDGKGTPREVIRSYFLNDFYADHLKTYQKRPIYWLFDSGKKNGFKALIYMHRYQSDLLARMRTDYVHEQQERYRTQLTHLADAIEHADAAERVKLTKQQKKLQEQALEIQKYEEKIHHLADQNIQIDLDDGVKHNYELFADVLAKIK